MMGVSENMNMIIKRDGSTEEFDKGKIVAAIMGAMDDAEDVDEKLADYIAYEIEKEIEGKINIEEIQDKVEQKLFEHGKYDIGKRYIIYREEHAKKRKGIHHQLDEIDRYLDKTHPLVRENSNAHYSFGALNKFINEAISKEYWLNKVYPDDVVNGYRNGDYHIHDLGSLTIYCCGYSLKDVITKGIVGVSNIPVSKPAKHFRSILAQVANITTIYQNESAGAIAFSSFDTLLSPFIKNEGLKYNDVKQAMQGFIFQINSNSRAGAEPAFSNLTFDLNIPKDLKDQKPYIAGKKLDFTYGECQKEVDMINRAFYEIMFEGDANGAGFAYPIPTYNIHEEFDWNNPNNEKLWEMTGKFGTPYFANFINSDMDVSDARSMCCRLRLDRREIQKKNGGLFGAGEKTGSIGVVTLNLARYGYEANDKKEFYKILDRNYNLAVKSLELKRKFLQERLDTGLIPAFKEYVGTLENHFSTVGIVAGNEMCLNLLGVGIETKKGKEFMIEVVEYLNEKLKTTQLETDNLYHLEATPMENGSHKLATRDKEIYNDIITQGFDGYYYYTNSCHLPVDKNKDINYVLEHQHDIQSKFSGGTVIHLFGETGISGDKAKHIIKTACENYEMPYLSYSPVYSICPEHGYVAGNQETCPSCGVKIESYQRITGYIRPVSKYNNGKQAEFKDRNQIKVD